MLGGWVVSHLWSRRLSRPGSSAGLAELQSLSMFQSVPTIYRSIRHLLGGRYISARWLYGVLITSAILLQLYSIAVAALMTPSLTETERTMTAPFLPSTPSFDVIANCNPDASTCLDTALSARALSDAMAFDYNRYRLPPGSSRAAWLEADSTYNVQRLTIQVAFPLGPINGHNLSDGGALWGIDLATVLSITSIPDEGLPHPPKSVWDSASFVIPFWSMLPSLQCLCGLNPNNVSHITIHNHEYVLASPITFDIANGGAGEIAGRLTDDNNTLVLAFYPSLPPNNDSSITYCATQLRFASMPLEILGIPATLGQYSPGADTIIVAPFPPTQGRDFDVSNFADGIPRNISKPPVPLTSFAESWLRGLGWGDKPATSPIVDLLRRTEIGTGFDDGRMPTQMFLEHYILVMLANGISSIFSSLLFEQGIQAPPPSFDAGNGTIQFKVFKMQYFIGIKTALQWFFLVVVIFDTIFVSFCLFIILWNGWYPDFSDPVTLAQVALSSSPPGISSSSDPRMDPSDIGILAQSPISLQNGPTKAVDPLLWKEKLYLVESREGFLVFKKRTSEK
ncbi:hypothetical protein NLI96_g7818 [Meripilus lineatus]|uniref:Uncharacterized protein n=1 Tax=Meripilus lineatus TaxID=2056292 RepID=A0AAD5YGV5_9APHY|nr:hypothetical protein NLI96_g7818 [Physisporinus lineatus]